MAGEGGAGGGPACQRTFPRLLLLCRYSAIKEHLAELDKETMSVLESLYNFSGAGSKPRERRDAGRQHSKSSKFLREFLPLMKLGSLDAKPTVNVSAGYKRRMNARIISGSSSIVNVRSPRDVVGFQLVGASSGKAGVFPGLPFWDWN